MAVHVSFPPCFLLPSICAPGLKNDSEPRNGDIANRCDVAKKLRACAFIPFRGSTQYYTFTTQYFCRNNFDLLRVQ